MKPLTMPALAHIQIAERNGQITHRKIPRAMSNADTFLGHSNKYYICTYIRNKPNLLRTLIHSLAGVRPSRLRESVEIKRGS
eukprot:790755-Amorphochlora_amoeboformis.AAC.2